MGEAIQILSMSPQESGWKSGAIVEDGVNISRASIQGLRADGRVLLAFGVSFGHFGA